MALVEDASGTPQAYALIVLGKGFAERPAPRPARPVYLSQLYCAGGMAGQGLGARLLDWTLAEARGWGADAVQLSVFSGNLRARSGSTGATGSGMWRTSTSGWAGTGMMSFCMSWRC